MAGFALIPAAPSTAADDDLAAGVALRLDAELYEYIAGELLEVSPSGYRHSRTGVRFGGHPETYATDNDLGEVVGADIGSLFRESPRLLLAPRTRRRVRP